MGCPHNHSAAFDYVSCFCGLTGENANPFAPWPTTTTTTLPLGPAPPLPSPTPTPPAPGPACALSDKCIQGLGKHFECYNIKRNGGHDCYKGIKVWQSQLTLLYGCPQFMNDREPIFESKAFCWCGLDTATTSASRYRAPSLPHPVEVHSQVRGGL